MTLTAAQLRPVMERAVEACIAHVEGGGLPFVGVVVTEAGVISEFGVNRVQETGDPSAHAEIVAMRHAMDSQGRTILAGATLLATGEPCGLCYRFAIDQGIEAIHVAVDRDAVAHFGIDYRRSYQALGIDEDQRAMLFHHLPVDRGLEPFTRYRPTNTPTGHKHTSPHTHSTGTSS